MWPPDPIRSHPRRSAGATEPPPQNQTWPLHIRVRRISGTAAAAPFPPSRHRKVRVMPASPDRKLTAHQPAPPHVCPSSRATDHLRPIPEEHPNNFAAITTLPLSPDAAPNHRLAPSPQGGTLECGDEVSPTPSTSAHQHPAPTPLIPLLRVSSLFFASLDLQEIFSPRQCSAAVDILCISLCLRVFV